MRKIVRITEGSPLPDNHSVERVLSVEEQTIGTGTATQRVYTVIISDDRYWMTANDKLNHPAI